MRINKFSIGVLFLLGSTSVLYAQATENDTLKKEKEIEGVTITRKLTRKTDAAVMAEMRQAKQVVSAISAEQISKSVDRNAAQAIQRVPGITIVDGKFVMIRGLAERYNNTLINGAIAPSTEVDRRTFAFDLIPAGMLDRMVIYKTATADKPGDFAGGVIQLSTTEDSGNFNRLDIGVGMRTNTTFKNYYQSKGSSTDAFGFDFDYRTLPGNFPTSNGVKNNSNTAYRASQLLYNNFEPNLEKAMMDGNLGFTFGRRFNIGSVVTSSVNTLNWSNSYESRLQETNSYFSLDENQQSPQKWEEFKDNSYFNDTRVSVMSNWLFRFNSRHNIKFKNLFNQIGENETVLRKGFNYQQRSDVDYQNYLMGYRSRTIYVGQVLGEHFFGEDKNTKVDWVGGFNYLHENEPDLRRFRTIQDGVGSNNYYMIDPPSSNLFDTSRYFGKLTETTTNFGLNFAHNFKNADDDLILSLKAGGYGDYRNRAFESRYMSYVIPGYVPFERRQFLTRLPLDQVFSSQYVNNTNGWKLQEGTRPNDSYDAQNILGAGYLMAEIPYGRFDLNLGVRAEHNTLRLQSLSENGQDIDVDRSLLSILPSGNLGYKLTDRTQLRLAYSKTVNRPEFREIAPFVFYDFKYNIVRSGNPDLETATIDNADFRIEFYPSRGEVINFGLFAKKFKNPIENVTVVVTENRMFNYRNADKATVYGAELEIRKSLSEWLTDVPVLNKMSVNLNASYIFSEVDLGSSAVSQDQVRPLQGQSPYIVNAALNYEGNKGWGANLIYNRFGNRIFSVSDDNFPSIYELSRDNFDFTVSKAFENVTLKLGVQNFLNSAYRFYEDTNRDYKIDTNIDKANYVFKRGALINFNVSINI